MNKLIFLFPAFVLINMQAEEGRIYSPKLYQGLWPDFCLEHLKQFPDECSEQYTDKEGRFYIEFIVKGSSEAYFDREIFSKLQHYTKSIPTNSNKCDFHFCPSCNLPIVRSSFLDYDDDNDEEFAVVLHKCGCLKRWYDRTDDEYNTEEEKAIAWSWNKCSEKTIPHQFFNIQSKQFILFLEQHLKYSQENPGCLCYWPYRSKTAQEISDLTYDSMSSLIENSYLKHLSDEEYNMLDFPFLKNRSPHGLLVSLFIHNFFYSQYRQVLLQVAKWGERHTLDASDSVTILDSVYSLTDSLQPRFLELYSQCLNKHPHPKIYYERGMVLFHQGKIDDSLNDISRVIDLAEKNHHDDLLTSELYFQEGTIYAELGLYDKAVEDLNKAIQKDPYNKQAYLERAGAYFELGNFDTSLEDYLTSGLKPTPVQSNAIEMMSFALGLANGVRKGGAAAATEYVPSLLSSLHGVGQGLWAFAQEPVQVSIEIVEATQACINFIKMHTPQETINKLVPELKELVKNWDQLKNQKRGELAGYIIGKYGVDIFAGAGLTKGMKAYRNLKRANNLLTYEAMALSERNKAFIKLEAARRAQARNEILKRSNLRILWDRQGKHIEGHRNFDLKKNRSIFTHSDPERLVREHCGKGIRSGNKQPGKSNYKEVVDFKEVIGYALDKETGEKVVTTWGIIHYAEDGVHIVPTISRQPIWK